MISDTFIAIKKIRLAHEFTLDEARKCEYPHGRGSFGLVYALEGQAEYRFLSGGRITIKEGEIFFISPDSAYSIFTPRSFRHYTVSFDIYENDSYFCADLSGCKLLKPQNTDRYEAIFKHLVSVWNHKKSGYEMQSTGILYELLASVFAAPSDDKRIERSDRLSAAKEYIDKHFDTPISLEKLAYLSNMSITNFRREWSKAYGETPMQYRDSVRIYYAKEYLNSGYYTVSEIAKRCGFEDISYFVRFFRKKTGITPGMFKKEYP